jgi:hypothetical protein
MNRKTKKIVTEAGKRGSEATKLLKLSNEVHQAEKQGLIAEKDAIDLAVNLNKQAVVELDKAIKLQKEFIDEQKSE